jgi:hypothetical protein
MQTIKRSEIKSMDLASGGKAYHIICPLCNFVTSTAIPIKDIKGLLCDNKQCREYLKVEG